MAERVGKSTLDSLLRIIKKRYSFDLELTHAYSKYRVVHEGHELSPPGTAGETYDFLDGMLSGMELMEGEYRRK